MRSGDGYTWPFRVTIGTRDGGEISRDGAGPYPPSRLNPISVTPHEWITERRGRGGRRRFGPPHSSFLTFELVPRHQGGAVHQFSIVKIVGS
ncbi:unnamed protein product [Calypogeia fissa]